MEKNLELSPSQKDIQRLRKKSGSFTVPELTDKKTKSLSRGLERLTQSIMRSHSTANVELVMHNSVLRDDVDSLKRLLKNTSKQPDVDNYSPVGITALHQACVIGSVACAKTLVEAGANIFLKTTDDTQSTALQLAVQNGHFEVAEYLISEGAQDEEIRNGYQMTN